MILHFPYLHQNEILYSGIARYYDYLNEHRIKWVGEHLFGKRNYRATVGFPSGLNNFYENLPPYNPYTPKYIIDNHSIYPLFRPFVKQVIDEKVINDMLYNNGKGIMTRLGIVASVVPNKRHLYYCPSCIQNQMDLNDTKFLDVYWNRVHQCPGVFVCHQHREWLRHTSFSLDEINQHSYVSLGNLIEEEQLNLKCNPVEEDKISQFYLKIAENIDWILNHQLQPKDLDYYRFKYIEYLKSRGIAKPSGKVDIQRLKKLFLDYYPKSFLQSLNSDINLEDDQTWVQMIVQKNRKAFHPVRHILMIMLLAESSSKFFSEEYIFLPFGSGPWECHSPVCMGQTELLSLGFSREMKQVYGDFICECGFKERRYTNGKLKVMKYGELWERELAKYLKKGLGIYPIARLLQADIATIKKYANKLGLLDKWTHPKKNLTSNKKSLPQKSNHYELWVNAIKENPNSSKTQIRNLVPASYAWLYSNDKQFLDENSPKPLLKKTNNKENAVDWVSRDVELLVKVKQIVQNWDNVGDKPTRKTKTAIGKKTNRNYWLEKYPEHFPNTLAYLNSVVETVEDFQIRRVKWVLNLEYEKREVKEWEVYVYAGLRRTVSERVKVFIQESVKMHNTKVSKVKLE